MPEIKRYVVTQTREVSVDAHHTLGAARIASHAFEHGQNINCGISKPESGNLEGVWGNTTTRIEIVETVIKKVR